MRVFTFPPTSGVGFPPVSGPGQSGIFNVIDYGAAAGRSTAENLQGFRSCAAAVTAAGGGTMLVPYGTFALPDYNTSMSPKQNTVACFDLPADMHFQVFGDIQGAVLCVGDEVAKTDTVNISAAAVPSGVVMGTTSFPGDFSAYTPGNVVVVQEQALGGNVANAEGDGITRAHQLGTDFLVVATANGTTLTTTTGLRMAYKLPKVSKCTTAIKVAGTLDEGTNSISGNYTALFAVGDWVRVENLDGTDTFWGVFGTPVIAPYPSISNKSYFEYLRVKAVDTLAITFDQAFAYTHTNVWLVKAGHRENVAIEGPGYIKSIVTESVLGGRCHNFSCRTIGQRYLLGFDISHLNVRMTEPASGNVWYISQSQHGAVNNIVVQGGAFNSNAAGPFKYTGCKGVTFSNVNVSTTADPSVSFHTDGFVTPYSMWNYACATSNVTTNTLIANNTDFFIGHQKKGSLTNLRASGGIVFIDNNYVSASNIMCGNTAKLELDTVAHMQIQGVQGACIYVHGAQGSEINNATLYGTNGINNSRVIQVLQQAPYDTSDLTLDGIDIRSVDAGDTGVYIDDAISRVVLNTVRDRPGLAASVVIAGNDGDVWIESECHFVNSMSTSFLPIASGALNITNWRLPVQTIDVEGSAAASDDLDTITGMRTGDTYVFRIQSSARNVVLKHLTGNIKLTGGADKTLDLTTDRAMLYYDGVWVRDIYVGP